MPKPMNKSLNVKLKPLADRDLSKIYQYSFRKFGKRVARNYIKDLDSAFNHIGNNPDSGQYCHYIKRNLCKYIIKAHVIFFYKNDTSIDVIRILHQSQNYIQHL